MHAIFKFPPFPTFNLYLHHAFKVYEYAFYSLFTLVSKVMDTNMQLEGRDRNLEEQDSIDRQGSKNLFFGNVLAKRNSSKARVSLASL
jgi:hypothetical protein